jgi:hypothetical protein
VGLVTVLVTGDTVFEPNEFFSVRLSFSDQSVVNSGSSLGVILNDDDPPPMTIMPSDISFAQSSDSNLAPIAAWSEQQPDDGAIIFGPASAMMMFDSFAIV